MNNKISIKFAHGGFIDILFRHDIGFVNSPAGFS